MTKKKNQRNVENWIRARDFVTPPPPLHELNLEISCSANRANTCVIIVGVIFENLLNISTKLSFVFFSEVITGNTLKGLYSKSETATRFENWFAGGGSKKTPGDGKLCSCGLGLELKVKVTKECFKVTNMHTEATEVERTK